MVLPSSAYSGAAGLTQPEHTSTGLRGCWAQEGKAANPCLCWMWLGILQGGERKRNCLQNSAGLSIASLLESQK